MTAVGEGAGAEIGVMGGTFDPIHLGHLAAAQEALCRLGLERVIFVPSGIPPHKPASEVTPGWQRWEMVLLATADHPRFFASRVEIDRPGPSYTVDTMAELQAMRPGCQWYFITGADALAEIATWKDPWRLAQLCRLVAVTRPGYEPSLLAGVPPEIMSRVTPLEVPGVAVSSHEIRARVRQGLPIAYLTVAPVWAYICKQGLYL